MKLKTIGSNQTEVIRGNVTLFYSYSTPVAAFVPGRGALVTSTKYSRTTSKHITQCVARWGATRTEVTQAEIDALAA
jgi:hypothetical protein